MTSGAAFMWIVAAVVILVGLLLLLAYLEMCVQDRGRGGQESRYASAPTKVDGSLKPPPVVGGYHSSGRTAATYKAPPKGVAPGSRKQ